jgi:hypothetical protein
VSTAGKELKTDHRTPAEVELDVIERKLNTVVIGLEVLTGICAGIQDADTPEEAEAEASDDGGEFIIRVYVFTLSLTVQTTLRKQTRIWSKT